MLRGSFIDESWQAGSRPPFSPAPVRIYFSKVISANVYDHKKLIDFTLGTRF